MLRATRRDADYVTQQELADALNLELGTHYRKSAISKWERGETRPPYDTVDRIEELLKTRIGLFFEAYHYDVKSESTPSGVPYVTFKEHGNDQEVRLDNFCKDAEEEIFLVGSSFQWVAMYMEKYVFDKCRNGVRVRIMMADTDNDNAITLIGLYASGSNHPDFLKEQMQYSRSAYLRWLRLAEERKVINLICSLNSQGSDRTSDFTLRFY